MRKGLKKFIGVCLSVVVFLLLLTLILWKTIPRWLPVLAQYWLPTGTSLSLSASPQWSDGALSLRSLSYKAGDCELAQANNIRLSKSRDRWVLAIDSLAVDTACLSNIPDSVDSKPLTLASIQKALPSGSVTIKQFSVTPWQRYAGTLNLDNDGTFQHISQQGDRLKFNAVLDNQQQLTMSSLQLLPPGGEIPLSLSGKVTLPATFNQLPQAGELHAEMQTRQIPNPLDITLQWQKTQGVITLTEKGAAEPLATLPWQLQDKTLQITEGQWRWPYAVQPLAGGISLTLSDWSDTFDQTQIAARLNVLTKGHNGKGNVVLTLGPGKIGLLNSDLAFQLTGQANLQSTSLSASLPGNLSGSVLNPELALRSGALLRAWGKPSPELTLQDARWPLAGVKVSASGVSGPLQAIVKARDSYWGAFDLHLNGKSQEFWPDQGKWDFNYWGNGKLPPLAGRWDMSGKGHWHDNLITLTSLSTGFNRLHYGLIDVDAPRLTLEKPLTWRRPVSPRYQDQRPALPLQFGGAIKLVAKKIALENGGYLPPAQLQLQLSGTDPGNFNLSGMLDAKPIGPIRLHGRWDGERLRGEGWWPKQQLTAFQPLLTPELGIKLREGSFYAQTAFSMARGQGFIAGGHWVVKNGGMWLPDGDLSGMDFSLSYRLKNQVWKLGVKEPVMLRIREVNNLAKMENVTADLQGSYPWSEASPLTLSNLGVDILGGHVSLSVLRMPQHDAAVLKLEKISLSELFTVLKPKQLAMSGSVDGELPLYVNNPRWIIRNGWIKNDGWLTLRLDPQFADAMASGNIANRLVIEWIRYMEIRQMLAKVNLDNLGELTLASHVVGANTSEKQDREVILNYTHQENIYQLWRSLRFGDNLQDWLQQQISLSHPSDAISSRAKKDTDLRTTQ